MNVLRQPYFAAGMVRLCRLWLLAICVLIYPLGAEAQRSEAIPPAGAQSAPSLEALLSHGVLTQPPPSIGSAEDRADIAAVEAAAQVSEDRWRQAEADGDNLYPRFESAFGLPLNRTRMPRTFALLHRAVAETSNAVFAAKDRFQRLRPYQRFQVARVCGEAVAPRPSPNSVNRESYPSGHAAFGWITASILSRLAPDRADALMQRASDYGESRVVCAMHYPSDVRAGEAVATAVLARLERTASFRQALDRANAEVASERTRRAG
jgi:acid phosphatase (class A)